MWSRINRLSIPISIKLTLLYTTILFCSLLITSSLTIIGVYYIMYHQAESDIVLSRDAVINYANLGKPLNEKLLRENILLPGVILRITDEQNNLLLDSAPYLPSTDEVLQEQSQDNNSLIPSLLKRTSLRAFHKNHTYFYYTNKLVMQKDQTYELHFLKTLTAEKLFIKTLIEILTITNLIGLLIAVLSGIFISRRILSPIRQITATAKEIEINDLGKRIEVKSSKDELYELTTTFNYMLNRIQTGFEQQRRFVADASHELRTPITVISGYANMLDRWGKQDSLVLAEGIDAIKSEAANMYNLIEKMLFLARADQNKQSITRVPLTIHSLIAEVYEETRLIAPQHEVVLKQNQSAAIWADAASIKQLLRIFIENSIKYTPAGGVIAIDSQKGSDHLAVTIEDTGIGIPAKDLQKIFDRFYRVDSSRTKMTGGAGLGLAIARYIAIQHDITIKVSSMPDQGTTITLNIPLYQERVK
ncbi:MAG: HAMP domain-containing protein [Pelosinus sp.]|nr:HAMP domain-containing protein [Pelosinus sp.]